MQYYSIFWLHFNIHITYQQNQTTNLEKMSDIESVLDTVIDSDNNTRNRSKPEFLKACVLIPIPKMTASGRIQFFLWVRDLAQDLFAVVGETRRCQQTERHQSDTALSAGLLRFPTPSKPAKLHRVFLQVPLNITLFVLLRFFFSPRVIDH